MPNTWFSADLHFGHKNIIKFGRPFETIEEHDEILVTNFNAVVKPSDNLILLGDIVFPQTGFDFIKRLNGIKTLVQGNHERHKIAKYLEFFKDIRGSKEYTGMICTHIPVHHSQYKRFGVNVHGHLHQSKVMLDHEVVDPRYLCISLEHTDYKPISLDEVRDRIDKQRANFYNNYYEEKFPISLNVTGETGPG